MLNWAFFSPRNFVVIGLIALIAVILGSRVSRAITGNGAAK